MSRVFAGVMIALCLAVGFPGDNMAGAAPRAAGAFVCGMFGPNITNNPTANLGTIATAMFATPGQSVPVAFLEQGPWFLVDSYGSGPLMGCQPASSMWATDTAPRLNSYNDSGMLQRQVVLVSDGRGGQMPVLLRFLYLDADPTLVANAEQLCFGAAAGSTAVYHLGFDYDGAKKLEQLTVTEDPGCTDYAGTYTYSYENAAVPDLPTKVDFVDGQENKRTTMFDYQVNNGLLQKVDFGGGANLTYAYSGTLLGRMNMNSPGQTVPLVIRYTPRLQWLSALTPGHNWGLTMTYQNGKVVNALQDTGCAPGECPPSVFTYPSAKMSDKNTSDKGKCFVATRQEHVAAGRASVINGNVYAKGSVAFLGTGDLRSVVPLREGHPGSFYFDWACR